MPRSVEYKGPGIKLVYAPDIGTVEYLVLNRRTLVCTVRRRSGWELELATYVVNNNLHKMLIPYSFVNWLANEGWVQKAVDIQRLNNEQHLHAVAQIADKLRPGYILRKQDAKLLQAMLGKTGHPQSQGKAQMEPKTSTKKQAKVKTEAKSENAVPTKSAPATETVQSSVVIKKTELLVITDRSGSMGSIQDDVIGGYNSFIRQQREVPGDCRVTFTQFDHEYEIVYSGVSIEKVPDLDGKTFVPRGSTALQDAIGRTLREQGARIETEKWADLVIVCILTDGQENSSREFNSLMVKDLIGKAEVKGWKFVYLGANQNSFMAAQELGMRSAVTADFKADAVGTQAAYTVTGSAVRSLRTSS